MNTTAVNSNQVHNGLKKLSLAASQLENMRNKFNLLSTDGGYSIESKKGIKYLRALGLNPSRQEYAKALESVKLENKDHFTFEETHLLVEKTWKEESAEEKEKLLLKCFKKLDKDGNGYLDRNEFEKK